MILLISHIMAFSMGYLVHGILEARRALKNENKVTDELLGIQKSTYSVDINSLLKRANKRSGDADNKDPEPKGPTDSNT